MFDVLTDHKLRIYFFSPFCILRNSTNRIFDVRMCDAFTGVSSGVTLVFPYLYLRENLKWKEVLKSYGVRNQFGLRMQLTPLTLKTPNSIRTIILLVAFCFSSIRILIENLGRLHKVVIVSRETIPLVPLLLLKKIFGKLIPVKVFLQMHEVKKARHHKWVYHQCNGLMPNVPMAKKLLVEKENIPAERIMVMNAPMTDFSETDCSKEEARIKINYTAASPLVVYTGKVGRGIAELDYIIEAATNLPDYHFIFTGGRDAAVKYLREYCMQQGLKNITFTGFFNDVTFIRYFQLAADVLVSYYSSKDHMVDFNYPQKLQEYLSSGNAIVTPDFSATREVINTSNAFIVEPDNPTALAQGIKDAIENKELAQKKARAAVEASKNITYKARVVDFINFFNTVN